MIYKFSTRKITSTILILIICLFLIFSLNIKAFAQNISDTANFKVNNSINASSEANQNEYFNNNNSYTSVYFTDDVHGSFQNAKTGNGMSYATVKALTDKANNENNIAYAVDAGDDIQGNAYVGYDKGERIMDILDSVGYTFRVPGNHEIDYGMDRFLDFFNKNNDYFACNFYNGTPDERGENVLSSYKIVNGANNIKIAFIGLMTPETITSTSSAYFKNENGDWIKYIDDNISSTKKIYDVFNNAIAAAKQQAGDETICIGVGHLGNEEIAKEYGIDAETVISKTTGLKAFIDAHSHTPYNYEVPSMSGKVQLIQAASGIATGSTELTGINRIGKIVVDNAGTVSSEILTNNSPEVIEAGKDSIVLQKEIDTINFVDDQLKENVCHNDNIETTVSKIQLRSQTNNVADMVTDSMYWYANTENADDGTIGADAAIINGGGINHKVKIAFEENKDITTFECLNLLRNNSIEIAEMTGYTLREALEYSVRLYGTDDENNSGFLQFAGIKCYLNPDIPSTVQVFKEGDEEYYAGPPTGQYRITGIQIMDKDINTYIDLDLNKTYRICSSNYLFEKFGNGYTMFKNLQNHYYSDKLADYQILAKYFNSFTTMHLSTTNSIPLLSSSGSPILTALKYCNYPINYENPKGYEEKIKIGVAPDPPSPSPDPVYPVIDSNNNITEDTITTCYDLTSVSADTSDNTYIYLYCLLFFIGLLSVIMISNKTKKL